MIQQKQNIWSRYKKWWIIGASIFAGVFLIGGFIVWSVLSWNDYEQRYTSWQAMLRTETDKALKLPAQTAPEREKKRTALRALDKIVDDGKNSCDRYQIIHWQQFIPRVKEWLDACNQLANKLDQFAVDMEKITDYLDAEQSIAKILSKASVTKLDEMAMKQQPQIWSGIEKEVGDVRVPKEFMSVQQLAKTKSKTILEIWQSLVLANDAKDRAKYEEAAGKLATAYDTFGEIVDLSEKTFLPLLTSLEKSYQHAFE